MNVQQKQQKGFTIIEVILVLAIAALIFLMVFIALPALQRGQRDTQRRQDLAKVITAVQNFQSNSQGKVPASAADVTTLGTYLKPGTATFKDPTGTDYTIKYGTWDAASKPSYADGTAIIYYSDKSDCGNAGSSNASTNANDVTVQMPLEGGGTACDGNK